MYRDILEEHAEEAAILWGLRKRVADSAQHTLEDLAGFDERIDAHLFGLYLAGDDGFECVMEMWDGETEESFFPLVHHAYRKAMSREIENILKVGEESEELAKVIVAALGRFADGEALGHVRGLIASDSTPRRRIGIAAGVAHGLNLEVEIATTLWDPARHLRSLVLDTIGESGLKECLSLLPQEMSFDDREIPFAAWRSAILLGDVSALSQRDRFIESDMHRQHAIDLAIRRLPLPDATGWLKKLSGGEDLLPAAIRGFGVLGDPSAVPFLLEAMRSPMTAIAAGEAFSLMTGLGEEAGDGYFTRDRHESEEEAGDFEEALRPVPERIALWWEDNRKRFPGGVRHLLGKPITPGNLQDILRKGSQVVRAGAAIELATMDPGKPLFDVRAHGDRQLRLLGIR